jgi:putative FmdB family regulatory protein
MPIYVYKCGNCGKEFELLQLKKDGVFKPNEREICNCGCGNWTPIRKISLSTFHLKGRGFYKTDYGEKS